ncbi:YoaK family protein [Allosalinactinospora lopnorensis]|uniref:YoaK family protein n=1 Tax=Allosalinactinospora lopnorensis TaxID=1352348 RepID=UPI000623CD28|nr:YoaK family protein [Allosalinactinospora lopnorensis]
MARKASGDASGRDPLPVALITLTAITGVVDAVSYLGLGGVFTAFMTGNLLFLGFAAAGGGLEPAASLTALAAFVLGASVGSRIGAAMAAERRRWLLTSAATVSVLITAAALCGLGLQPVAESPSPRHYAVIALTAAAMGVRSATVRRLGAPLNTTLVTFTLVSLLMDSSLGKGTGHPEQKHRLLAVIAVFVGGAIGTLLLQVGLTLPLLVAAAGSLGTIAVYLAHPASRRPPT